MMSRKSRSRARGITLVELLVVLLTLSLLVALAVPATTRALQSAHRTRLAGIGQALFHAVQRYVVDHGHPPPPGSSQVDGLNLRTLAPLAPAGYLPHPGALLDALRDRRVTAYDTPGPPGKEGFWMLLIDGERAEIQVLVASTDQFPLSPGVWIEGIYQLRGNRLERLADARPTERAGQAFPMGHPEPAKLVFLNLSPTRAVLDSVKRENRHG